RATSARESRRRWVAPPGPAPERGPDEPTSPPTPPSIPVRPEHALRRSDPPLPPNALPTQPELVRQGIDLPLVERRDLPVSAQPQSIELLLEHGPDAGN